MALAGVPPLMLWLEHRAMKEFQHNDGCSVERSHPTLRDEDHFRL